MLLQKDAIVRLLRDDDPETVELVKQQLAQRGAAEIADLRDLLQVDDERVAQHARQVLAEIDARLAAQELTALCPVFAEQSDLEAASWLIARAFLPGVDIPAAAQKLEHWAAQLSQIRPMFSAEERVRFLAHFLGQKVGLHGNADDYYQVDNSLLPRVLETKLGIPISLVLIYQLVGRRCGLDIEGVNFPGHFLARHAGVLFDPFESGRIIREVECQEILARQKLTLHPNHLCTASARAMLRRILANLLYVFQNEGAAARAALVTGWIHALDR